MMLAFHLSLLDTPEQKGKFEMLYRQSHKLMFYIAYQTCHDYHKSEDILQKVLIKLIQNIDTIKTGNRNHLKRFLVHVTRNYAVDVIRCEKHEIGMDGEILAASAPAVHSDAEQLALDAETIDWMRKDIRTLSEIYRVPLVLQAQGYTTADIDGTTL